MADGYLRPCWSDGVSDAALDHLAVRDPEAAAEAVGRALGIAVPTPPRCTPRAT